MACARKVLTNALRCALALALAALLVPAAPAPAAAKSSAPVAEGAGASLAQQQAVIEGAVARGEDPQAALDVLNQQEYNFDEGSEAAKLAEDAAEEYPSKYFLTNTGDATSVKLQSPFGDCWAFAATSALESSYLKHKNGHNTIASTSGISASAPKLSALLSQDQEIDLSEHTVAWYAFEPHSGGSQNGEGLDYKVGSVRSSDYGTYSENGRFDAGLNVTAVENMYTSGYGVVNEAQSPYTYKKNGAYVTSYEQGSEFFADSSASEDWMLSEAAGDKRSSTRSDVFVTDVNKLPVSAITERDGSRNKWVGYDASATAAIKKALVEDGAVAISYSADRSKPQDSANNAYMSSIWGQFNYETYVTTDHAAAIVGWDDTISADDLGAPDHPAVDENGNKVNGAWLVKNNWGSDELYSNYSMTANGIEANLANTGFYWLSYCDHTLLGATSFKVADAGYDNAYQYDFLGTSYNTISGMGWESDYVNRSGSKIMVANVFTSNASKTETLKAVSVRTPVPKANVSVRVCKLDSDGHPDLSVSGELSSYDATGSAAFERSGFHVIELPTDKRVELSPATKYAVVAEISYEEDGDGGMYTKFWPALELGCTSAANASSAMTYSVTAKCAQGETFVYFKNGSNATWYTPNDFMQSYLSGYVGTYEFGNAMIKAYTDDAVGTGKTDISAASVSVAGGGDVAWGTAPEFTVTLGGKPLERDVDYIVDFGGADLLDLGSKAASLKGIGAYDGVATVSFNVVQADVSNLLLIAKNTTKTYKKYRQAPDTTAWLNGHQITLMYSNYKFMDANWLPVTSAIEPPSGGHYLYRIIVQGSGESVYTGSVALPSESSAWRFYITNSTVKDAEIAPIDAQLHTGSAVQPKPVVKVEGSTLKEGVDFTYEYSNNTDISTAESPALLRVRGMGYYEDVSAWTGFTIAKDIVASVDLENASFTYDGTEKQPAVTNVTSRRGVSLTAGTDYTITYRNNINAGKAKAVITGKGDYAGTIEKEFTISKAAWGVFTLETQSLSIRAKGDEGTIGVVLPSGASVLNVVSEDGAVASARYAAGKIKVAGLKEGETRILVSIPADGNHEASETVFVEVTVLRKSIPVPQSASGLTYNASVQVLVEGGVGYMLTLDGIGLAEGVSAETKLAGDHTVEVVLVEHCEWEDTDESSKSASRSYTVNIAPAPIRVAALPVVKDKTWDGTANAEIDGDVKFSGKIGDDDVTVLAAAQFEDVEASDTNKKKVRLTYELAGADKDNYVLEDTSDFGEAQAYIYTRADAEKIGQLQGLVDTAGNELANIYRSNDGKDVPDNREWVTPTVYDALKSAYDYAIDALASSAPATVSIEKAKEALEELRQGETFFGSADKRKGLQLTRGESKVAAGSAGTVRVSGNGGATVTLTGVVSVKPTAVIDTVMVDGVTYKVTAIANNAFKGSSLAKVTVGGSVSSIGANAFAKAPKLTSVTLGPSVKTVGAGAFSGCKKLKTFTFGKGVARLGAKMFSGCKKLKTVTVMSPSLNAKSAVKNFLKGSKVKTVKVKGMSAKQKKAVKTAIKKGAGKKGLKVK